MTDIPAMRLPAPALFAARRTNQAQATGFIWPVAGRVTQVPGQPGTHAHADAYDIAAAYGTPVIAPEGARVKKIILPSQDNPYGLNVILAAGDTEIRLAHLSSIPKNLQVGQPVSQNQVVGYVGSTGNSTGPHLHVEFLNPQDRPEAPGTYHIPGVTQPIGVGQQVTQVLGLDEILGTGGGQPGIYLTSRRAVVSSPVTGDGIRSVLPITRTPGSESTPTPPGTRGSSAAPVLPSTRDGLIQYGSVGMPGGMTSQQGKAAVQAQAATPADQGQILLQTPFGPVRAPAMNWIRVGAFIGGGVILLIGLAGISRGTMRGYYGAQLRVAEAIPGGAGIASAIRGKDIPRASREVGKLNQ